MRQIQKKMEVFLSKNFKKEMISKMKRKTISKMMKEKNKKY